MAEKNDIDNQGAAPKGMLSPIDANAQIASKLQELYESVREETIPDRFLDLLEKLDEVEQKSKHTVTK